MLYTTLKISTVFSLPDDEFKLHVFDIDKNSKKLLIFFYKKQKIGQDINKFQIYDLESSKLMYET